MPRTLSSSSHSNLDCFLKCTTPSIPLQSSSKSGIQGLNNLFLPINKKKIEYFTLRDLWDQYDEWSAYGAGAPVVLTSGETVVQYYVPYLSAIQIYTSKSFTRFSGVLREECNVGELESDSWSEDSESSNLSRSPSNNSSRGSDTASEDSSFDQEGALAMKDQLGHLYFQYFENSSPYGRIPLMDKINELSRSYPGLMSFKSVDLSPASWMSVAWYPIYHIPSGKNVKDLSACFLTYHTLSLSFQGYLPEDKDKGICSTADGQSERKCKGESSSIPLPPFGLATYKMHGNLWINPETSDHDRIVSLLGAANSWLKQLGVQHPDSNYFNLHSVVK
ncbi:hypothetical protein MRB53_022763 [Persea americana]|uniref:Uncharacterized protein n=1 Tax=Persea americana TaxID=3435 RepID=A0ACC2L7Y1_PERAE|nr:hypothetical protein MRB53_022763 [Persea americana]